MTVAGAAAPQPSLNPSAFQQRVLSVPPSLPLMLLGGRGGGKTVAMLMRLLRDAIRQGPHARLLWTRQEVAGLLPAWEQLLSVLNEYPSLCPYKSNKSERTIRLATGGVIYFSHISDRESLNKWRGQSLTGLYIDEISDYGDLEVLDFLQSCLRSPHLKAEEFSLMLTANPGGRGSVHIANRYIKGYPDGTPFETDFHAFPCVVLRSTYRDNGFIDQTAYRKQLVAACGGNMLRILSEVEGQWDAASGSIFAGSWDASKSIVDLDPKRCKVRPRDVVMAWDWGGGRPGAAPSVALLMAMARDSFHSLDGKFIPRGSVLVMREFNNCGTTASGEMDYNHGGGNWNTSVAVSAALEMLAKEGLTLQMLGVNGVVGDSAMFSDQGAVGGSLGQELRKLGLPIMPAPKRPRAERTDVFCRLMAGSGEPGTAGLYVDRSCQGWLSTVPLLPPSEKDPMDTDPDSPDHWWDATAYGYAQLRGRWVKPDTQFRVY
jgi:hypothetical protein